MDLLWRFGFGPNLRDMSHTNGHATTAAVGVPQPAAASRAVAAVTPPAAPKRKANVAIVAGGVALMLLAAVIGAAVFSGATARTEVLSLARDVEAGQRIEADDLSATAIAGGAGVEMVAVDGRENVIGRTVSASLPAGSILHPDFFDNDTALVVESAKQLGIELGPDEYPFSLAPDAEVTLYLLADGATHQEVPAEVVSVAASGNNNLHVNVNVDQSDAGQVAAAAAADRIVIGRLDSRTIDALDRNAASTGNNADSNSGKNAANKDADSTDNENSEADDGEGDR